MNNNRCVVCNEIIPEGRMLCPSCEHQHIKIGMILQSRQATAEEVEQAYDFIKQKGDKNGRKV